ncbi:Microtubule-actin cross-linking factor 1 [Trichinella murrelli]|uniref:Microtubule-actin cross-linking factor 1 n=1 Tax=Trichinella murrelli TaxID=144512 RepID=A0A0V0TSK2_9BILA|nr:Microtubule-actin cross-linking factor 1 [Trichinella murrelli]
MLTDTLTLIYQTEKLPHDIAGNFIEKLYDNSTIEDHFQENDEKNRTLSVQKNRLFLDERSGQLCQATIGKWFLNERFSRCSTLNTACSNQRQYCGVNFNLRKSYELKLSKLVPSQSIIYFRRANVSFSPFQGQIQNSPVLYFVEYNVALSYFSPMYKECSFLSGRFRKVNRQLFFLVAHLFFSTGIMQMFPKCYSRYLSAVSDQRGCIHRVRRSLWLFALVARVGSFVRRFVRSRPRRQLRPTVIKTELLVVVDCGQVRKEAEMTNGLLSSRLWCKVVTRMFYSNVCSLCMAAYEYWGPQPLSRLCRLVFRLDALRAFASPVASASSRTYRFFSTKSGADILRTHFRRNRLVDMTYRGRGNAFFQMSTSSSPNKNMQANDDGDSEEVTAETISKESGSTEEESMLSVLATAKAERANIQKKAFTVWMNRLLESRSKKVNDLFVDLKDGTLLLNVLELLTGKQLKPDQGLLRIHHVQNVSKVLNFLIEENVKLVNMRPEHIVDGNEKLILGLVWVIILHFQLNIGCGVVVILWFIKLKNWSWPVIIMVLAYGTGVDGSSVLAREQSDDTVRFFCHDHHRSQQQQHYHYYLLRQTDACCLLVECVWLSLYNCALFLIGFLLLFGLSAHLMYKILKSYHRKAERKHEVTCEPLTLSPQSRVAGHQQQHQQQRSTSSTVIGGGSNDSHHHHHGNGKNGSGSLLVAAQPSSGADWRAGSGATAPQILTGGGAGGGGGYSESSSYETHAHYERKVQRVKKTRSDRDRSSNRRSTDRRLVKVSEPWHEVERRGGFSAKEGLLNWVQDVTSGYSGVNVQNFTTSWRDGLAFNAILHRFRPDLVKWSEVLHRMKPRERLENAFELFEKEFQVSRLLDPEDVDVSHPEEKSLTVYISMLYNALSNLEMPNFQDEVMRYRLSAREFSSWLQRAINSYQNASAHPSERLLAEIDEFRKEEMRNKHREKERLEKEYADLEEKLSNIDVFSVEHEFTPGRLNRLWEDLLDALAARERALGGDVRVDLDELARNLNLQIGITNEKLDELLQQIEAADNNTSHDSVDLIVDGLNALESPIEGFFHDVDGCLQLLDSSYVSRTERERLCRNKTQIFTQVCDYIQWVEQRIKELSELEFSEKLSDLDSMLEKHKLDHAEIMDFRTTKLSTGRMLDLDMLTAFVRAAQLELMWIQEREVIEVTRNWSDFVNLDLSMLQNYYKQLMHEIELREAQFNDVHDQGAALLNQRHPAVEVIELYVGMMQAQWDWLLGLTQCLEVHLQDSLNLSRFLEDVSNCENWFECEIQVLTELSNRRFNYLNLDECESMLAQLKEMRAMMDRYSETLISLSERSRTLSPLWQRGERITTTILVTALCNYLEKDIVVHKDDECILIDNSDLVRWRVQFHGGVEFEAPSVIFRIPPPDTRVAVCLQRLQVLFDRMRRLWLENFHSIRFMAISDSLRKVRSWDLKQFLELDPASRDGLVSALNNDANELLAELDEDDPLSVQLRDELNAANEHFYRLIKLAQREPDPDVVENFDRKAKTLLQKLDSSWKTLMQRIADPIPRTADEWDKATDEHKAHGLQALDSEMSMIQELFRQILDPSPMQRALLEQVLYRWENLWETSKMHAESIKAVEAVLTGIVEANEILNAHERTLCSYDYMPSNLDQLRNMHAELLSVQMLLQQQQAVFDDLSSNVGKLRQHVARTRFNVADHYDINNADDDVQELTVRWENICYQVIDRLNLIESATGVLMQYQSAYENENAWLERVEKTIDDLRIDESINPEEYQKHLDLLMAEYRNLTERTEAVEHVNREGGRFIREAKTYDSRISQYRDSIMERNPTLSFGSYSSMSGHRQVAKDLEDFNRRFSQLASVILERRNVIQVWMQSYRRRREEEERQKRAQDEAARRAEEEARRRAEEEAERLRRLKEEEERRRRAAEEEAERLRRLREQEEARRAAEEARRRAEEEARRLAEAEARRRAEEEARRRADEEARRRAEEEARRRAEEEARRRAEEEARRRAEAEARRRAEEEARRRAEEEARRRAEEEEARRKAQEAALRRAAEEAERLRLQRAREDELRRAEEEARRRAKQAEEEAAARLRAEEEARRRAEEEARRRAEAEAAQRRADAEARRRADEEARRRADDEARRRADEEARRRAEEEARRRAEEEARRRAEEEARRRAEEEARRRQLPKLDIKTGRQFGEAMEWGEAGELEETGDLAGVVKVSEHEDDMIMYAEETEIRTKFFELEAVKHLQTGEILTFVEAARQGVLDLKSGEFFDVTSGSRMSLEEAVRRGFVSQSLTECLNSEYGIHDPETRESITLMEAIRRGIYDPELRQLKNPRTGELLSLFDASTLGVITMDNVHRLIKMGILKLPPLHLQQAIEQAVIDLQTGTFIGRFSRETLPLTEALRNGYVTLSPTTQPGIGIALTECIEQRFIDANTGVFDDRVTGEKISLRDAVSKKTGLVNLHYREVVNTSERRRVTVEDALFRNVLNTRLGNYTDTQHRQTISLSEAYERELIQQPLTLFDVNARGLIDSTGRFVDAGTKRRMVLLEAIADGLLEPDVPHIVDSDEGDVVSIAVALERGLLTPTGEYVQHDPLRTISIQEAVNKSLIVSPLRYSFFDIKGIKDTKANRTLSFNEALDAGVIVLSSRRLVDTATNDSYMLDEIPQDCSIVDSAVLSVLNRPSGLIKKDHHHQSSRSTSATATAELTVLEAVARGVIDSKKAVLLNSRQQHFSPRQAYESGLISLRGALLMSALFNVHPGLVMPSGGASGKSSRSSARKRTPRRARDFAAQPGLKMTLAEALHQGLVDPLKQTVVEDGREMTLQQAVDFGFIDMSTQWIVPDQGNKGPTIQESQSEEVTETSQVLAPKDTTDKHVEETVTTVKRQRITETTAVGGGAGSGVSAYRAITSRGQGGRLVVPVEGMHIYDAQRKGLLDLNTGMLTVPDVDRKLTFEEAIDLGIVNSGHLQVRGGRRGALNAAEAIEQGLLDPTGFHVDPLTKERRSLQAAIDADLVLVEPESLPDTRQSTKVIQFGLGASRGGAVLSFNPTGTSTREESELGWSFNSTTGEVVDEQTGERFSLDEALRRGKVAEEDFRVVDALTERELTFSDAEKWGVIESTSKMYVNKRDARVCSLQEAAKQGLLFYVLGMPQYARDTVETRVRRQSRRVVSNKESALAGPAAFVDYSLQKVIDLGWYDATSGLFTHPDTKKQMSLRQAIIRGLFNPYECSIRHPATGERISLLDAIQVGLIDADRGLVVDSRSGRTYDLRQACQEGIICSGVVPQSLEAAIACGRLDLSAGTVSFPDGRTALSLHDAVASGVIDPASIRVLDPASGREMSFAEAVAERVVNLSRGLVLNKSTGEASSLIQAIRSGTLKPVASADTRRYSSSAAGSQEQQLLATSGTFFGSLTTAGGDVAKTSVAAAAAAGREEMVDIGGKQVMVKVIRDEQGVEKGEYVDPETKMKFTIQLHGDPYTTRAQTSVKSTAQVQSVELSPFVELVGIDKVLDKRTGRVMTLAEAQRAGLASVDRKGKQLTKSYAVFRSDLAHALAKGVVDPTTGERLSLEDAIKSRLIDIGNLVLWHPDSSSMDLAQAANVGLIDVTLAEVLPKGVCHPVSGERISTKRAIELKIINARTGEVCNPYSNERLTWLSIVKPVYASLVMEGVYDPRKGYAVPLSRALIEGLIDARARTYCNPITGEVLSLEEASGHGLVDEGTYKLILQPLIRDYRRTAAGEEMLCLLDAVRVGLVDPHARTVVVDRGATVPIANAVREGKFPRELGRLMRRVDKWTFAEALGQGLIDVAANQFTDPDSGQKLTIAAALQQGYIDTGSVEALEGADERNLSNVLESDEFDEHSGRIRDRRTGLYLTFKQAIERGIIDGDSLIYDVTAGRALTLNEALLKGRIDNSGKFVDSKTAARVSLKDAARVGLLALIASPMLAGQAAAEAIKRREAEGYRFAVEPVSSGGGGGGGGSGAAAAAASSSGPNAAADLASSSEYHRTLRQTTTTTPISLSSTPAGKTDVTSDADITTAAAAAAAAAAAGCASPSSRLSSAQLQQGEQMKTKEDASLLQSRFFDELRRQNLKPSEWEVFNPATGQSQTLEDAVESGLLDLVSGELIDPNSGQHYSIPKAVHLRWLSPAAGNAMMASLNKIIEQRTGERPDISTAATPGLLVYTREVSWRGQPSELRASDGDLPITGEGMKNKIDAWINEAEQMVIVFKQIHDKTIEQISQQQLTSDGLKPLSEFIWNAKFELSGMIAKAERLETSSKTFQVDCAHYLSPDGFHKLQSLQDQLAQQASFSTKLIVLIEKIDQARLVLTDAIFKSEQFSVWLTAVQSMIEKVENDADLLREMRSQIEQEYTKANAVMLPELQTLIGNEAFCNSVCNCMIVETNVLRRLADPSSSSIDYSIRVGDINSGILKEKFNSTLQHLKVLCDTVTVVPDRAPFSPVFLGTEDNSVAENVDHRSTTDGVKADETNNSGLKDDDNSCSSTDDASTALSVSEERNDDSLIVELVHSHNELERDLNLVNGRRRINNVDSRIETATAQMDYIEQELDSICRLMFERSAGVVHRLLMSLQNQMVTLNKDVEFITAQSSDIVQCCSSAASGYLQLKLDNLIRRQSNLKGKFDDVSNFVIESERQVKQAISESLVWTKQMFDQLSEFDNVSPLQNELKKQISAYDEFYNDVLAKQAEFASIIARGKKLIVSEEEANVFGQSCGTEVGELESALENLLQKSRQKARHFNDSLDLVISVDRLERRLMGKVEDWENEIQQLSSTDDAKLENTHYSLTELQHQMDCEKMNVTQLKLLIERLIETTSIDYQQQMNDRCNVVLERFEMVRASCLEKLHAVEQCRQVVSKFDSLLAEANESYADFNARLTALQDEQKGTRCDLAALREIARESHDLFTQKLAELKRLCSPSVGRDFPIPHARQAKMVEQFHQKSLSFENCVRNYMNKLQHVENHCATVDSAVRSALEILEEVEKALSTEQDVIDSTDGTSTIITGTGCEVLTMKKANSLERSLSASKQKVEDCIRKCCGPLRQMHFDKDADNCQKLIDQTLARLQLTGKNLEEKCKSLQQLVSEGKDARQELIKHLRLLKRLCSDALLNSKAAVPYDMKEIENLLLKIQKMKHNSESVTSSALAIVDSSIPYMSNAVLETSMKEELETLTQALRRRVKDFSNRIESKEKQLEEARSSLTNFLENLKNMEEWLCNTELMIRNQKVFSSNPVVIESQLREQELLGKLLDDKSLFWEEISKACSPPAGSKLARDVQDIDRRFSDMKNDQESRMSILKVAFEIACIWNNYFTVLADWLQATEAQVNDIGYVTTDEDSITKQFEKLKVLEKEFEESGNHLEKVMHFGQQFQDLLCDSEAAIVGEQMSSHSNRYQKLYSTVQNLSELLSEMQQGVLSLTERIDDVDSWLNDLAERLNSVPPIDDIQVDVLSKQSQQIMCVAEEISRFQIRVAKLMEFGHEMCKNMPDDEAETVQHRLELLHLRYAELSDTADERMLVLQDAFSAAWEFSAAHTTLSEWLSAVEEDLVQIDEVSICHQLELINNIESDTTEMRELMEKMATMGDKLNYFCSSEGKAEICRISSRIKSRYSNVCEQLEQLCERSSTAKEEWQRVMAALDGLIDWLEPVEKKIKQGAVFSADLNIARDTLERHRMLQADIFSQRTRANDILLLGNKVSKLLNPDDRQFLVEKMEKLRALSDAVTDCSCSLLEHLEELVATITCFDEAYKELDAWLTSEESEVECMHLLQDDGMHDIVEVNKRIWKNISDGYIMVEKLEKYRLEVKKLACADDAARIAKLTSQLTSRYENLKNTFKMRADVIERTQVHSGKVIYQLDGILESLNDCKERFNSICSRISDRPELLSRQIEENMALVKDLERKQSLCHSLINGIDCDDEVKMLSDKADLIKLLSAELFNIITSHTYKLHETLRVAGSFWNLYAACMEKWKPIESQLSSSESATCEALCLIDMRDQLIRMKAQFSDKQASAEGCEKLGNQLLKLVGDEFKSNVVETVRQLKTTNQRITDLLNKRDQEIEYKLNKADSMTQLSDHILLMLKNVEDQINNFQDISDQLEQLNEQFQEVLCLKDQLDAVTVLVEQLKQLCETFCSGSPVTDVSYARHAYETISSHLKLLYSIASSRHQDLEKALLQVGCAQVALDQMINWIEKTTGTVHELRCIPGDIKSVDLQLAVLRAVANDVAAHRATMAEVTDAVTRNRQLHPDQSSEQSSMVEKVEIMQSKWDALMASIDVKLSELEYSKQETFRFLDMFVEWQVWMSDVESAISNGRHVGGLPDTAKEQLEKFQLIVADVASKKSTIDSAIVDALDYTRDNSALQSPLFAEIQKFETRWKLLQKRVEEHSQKLERALKQAIEFDSLVTECSCWQQRAEQYLNHLEPASRLKAKLKTQMEQHLTFCEEIDTRRQQMLTLDGCGTRMKYTCRRPDATLIKNQLATMLTSWSKILTRAADRSKQLDTVSRSCTSFFDQLEQLNCKFDELQDQFQQLLLVQQHLSPGGSGSGGGGGFSVEHLVQALDQLSMFQGQLSALSADLDRIAAQGRQLREHAIAEEQQVIGDAVSAARDKWNGLNGALLERQARLEQALLFNGQLEEAVDVLMVWLRQAEELLGDDELVGGDVDTLLELDERLQTLRSGLQSRESSIASIRDMRNECSSTNEQRQQQQLSDSIVEKVDVMLELWDTVSRLVDQRHAALCKSRADAERLKTDCGALFEWLAQAETRARPTEQNCERRIAALEHLIEEIDSKRGSVDEVLELGRRIRAVCHPKAEKPLERCLTALEARYAQTLQMVRQRLLRLKSDLDQEKQLDVDLKLLLDWVQKMQAKIDSLQDNLPSYTPGTADVLDEQHRKIAELIERQLMFEVSLQERQREVDEATADFRTVEAEQLGLVTPGAAASRPKNARTAQLVAAWRKLWLGCISYKNALNERLHYIIEMKQLSGFSFEDWRRRYVRWMAERKCRAVDLFKRYDCDGDGRLTCDQFRDAILNSRFKTSKAEMDLVVEAIDRNHDGFVDMTEFLHALRADSEHFTDDKRITEEIAKQLNLCSCKQKYRVEEVRPGRCYRLGERLKLVRIYRSTVMVRVGGGWQTFQEFMSKNDPCRAKGRTNLELREQFILPEGGSQAVWLFRRKNVKPEKAAKLTSGGTSYGPVTKIREKTERSMPMCSTGGAVAGNASVADNVCETSPAEPSSITACDAGDHSSSQANLPANTDASGVTSPHRSSEREIDTAETSKRRKEQRTSSAAAPSSLQPPSTSSSSHRKNNTTTGRGRRGGRSRKNF